MNLIDKMTNEISTPESIFMSYIQKKSSSNFIFAFFEGEDDYKYYKSRIDNKKETTYEIIPHYCRSKPNVKIVQELITQNASNKGNSKTLYFIDSDYDDNTEVSKDIYVTVSYSIENNYFTDRAIREMLKAILGTSFENSVDVTELNTIQNYIIEKRDRIIEDIIFQNAWYSLQIKKSQHSEKKPKLNRLRGYNDIKALDNISKLEIKAEDTLDVFEEEIDEEIKRLRENPVCLIRGKFLLDPMISFLKTIFQDAGKKRGQQYFKRHKVIRNQLQDILLEFSAFAHTPEELTKYIEKRLSE